MGVTGLWSGCKFGKTRPRRKTAPLARAGAPCSKRNDARPRPSEGPARKARRPDGGRRRGGTQGSGTSLRANGTSIVVVRLTEKTSRTAPAPFGGRKATTYSLGSLSGGGLAVTVRSTAPPLASYTS